MAKKQVTFADIAEYTGFSKTTISRYFNHPDSLTLENQEKIAKALDELGYRKNKLARVLANGKSEFVGIIVPNLYLHYYSEMLTQLLRSYSDYHYKFLVFVSDGGPEKEMQYLDELMVINGGVWEGKPWADLPRLYPESYRLWQEQMHLFHVQGGESMQQVFDRMRQAVCGIAAGHCGKTIAVVSHGCAIRNFLCYAAGEDISHLDQVGWADNTAVSKVEFDVSGHCRLIFKNDASHLPPELSTLAKSRWCRHDGKSYLTDQTYTPGIDREQEAQA